MSLLLGVCQFAGFLGLATLAAIVSGHIGVFQISRSGGRQYGLTMAVMGLALGYAVALVYGFLIWALLGIGR